MAREALTLSVLFRSYYERLCAFARRYVGSSETAEDVVQEVFASLWEQPGAWRKCEEPQRYLYVAVRNRALKHLAHARVVRQVHGMIEGLGRPPAQGQRDARPDAEAEANELMAAFCASVDRLPSRRREAYLRCWNGMTQAEVANGMGISVRTVETQVARARKALRRDLAQWM